MIEFDFPEYHELSVQVDRLFVNLDQTYWISWLRDRAIDRDKFSGITLGAYRRGKSMVGFRGGVIEVWVKCARTENATGVPWPHVWFKQIVGRRGHPEDASIYCPACRAERPWEKRQQSAAPKKSTPQLTLF